MFQGFELWGAWNIPCSDVFLKQDLWGYIKDTLVILILHLSYYTDLKEL